MLRQAALRVLIRTLLRPGLDPRVPVSVQRRIISVATRLRRLPRSVRCEQITLGGIPVQQLTPVAGASQRALIFLHGGGYILGSPETHRNLSSHLSLTADCSVYAPQYRLAPEHPFPAALNDALAVYRALLAQGLECHQIAISGDSAGGGLALALTLRLRDEQLPLPAALCLLSPWVDLTLSGESQYSKAKLDPLLKRSWGEANVAHYSGSADASHPLISPLFANYHGMPPMLIQCGSDEIVLSDSERLAERARAAGVKVDLNVCQGLWHDFQLFAGLMPAATTAVREAGDYLRRQWRAPVSRARPGIPHGQASAFGL